MCLQQMAKAHTICQMQQNDDDMQWFNVRLEASLA